MKVSVVIPAFNHEEFVTEAIVSLYDQSHRDMELVVVDDCSPDGTYERLAGLFELSWMRDRFTDVKLLRNAENLGAALTINFGVENTSADIVCIMNSDDIFDSERISKMSALISEDNQLIFSGIECIDQHSMPIHSDEARTFERINDRSVEYPFISHSLITENRAISTGNLVFTRSLFDKCGPFQPLRYCHDWMFVLNSIIYTEPVLIPEALYKYRIHGGNSYKSLSTIASAETQLCMRSFLERLSLCDGANPAIACLAHDPAMLEEILGTRAHPAVVEWRRLNGWVREQSSAGACYA